ncbi:MAG: glucosaminidase domain-containing protein [Duncaniella sp.]|nr:glucosaminidase domain-containing protein [Duncaniella sp.]HBI57495.1 hypothetical protein [Porphyromonadaceae bacterium]
MRLFITSLLLSIAALCHAATPITGQCEIGPEQMWQFVLSHNPDFPRETAEAFYEVGNLYNIRGDIALCQAIIETGWFKFENGTAVTADDHNYCGLGVRKRGKKGCSFSSAYEGVTAMIQHLFAYATDCDLPDDEPIVDPRFNLVNRGCAPTWESLSGRWAMNTRYGRDILTIYNRLADFRIDPSLTPTKTIERIEVIIPE